jgi:hypothetical protein
LVSDLPELVISHALTNTGSKAIDTSQFNHNFLMIDGIPIGPGVTLRLPFAPRITARPGRSEILTINGKEIAINEELKGEESALVTIEGYDASLRNYDISVENRNAGAGVRIKGDSALETLRLYVNRRTVAPEPFTRLRIAPGATEKWQVHYTYYEIP